MRAQLDKELLKFPWLAPVAIEIFGGKFDPAKLTFPIQPDPSPQTDAGERHPRLDGDSRLGDRPDCEAPAALTAESVQLGNLEAPVDRQSNSSYPGVLFILTLVFGFWLSRSGKPYHTA